MRDHRNDRRWRRGLLRAGATVVLGVALSAGVAVAQVQPVPGMAGSGSVPSPLNQAPSQQPGSGLPVVAGQIRTAAQSLRNAAQQVAGQRPPNFGMARTAVSAGQAVIEGVPPQTPSGAARDAARMSLTRAEALLGRPDPAPVDVAQELIIAADALDNFAARLVGNVIGDQGPPAAPWQGGGAGTVRPTE